MQSALTQPRPLSFYETLTAAVRDFAEHGYDNEYRLERWLKELRVAAWRDMVPEAIAEKETRNLLMRVYRRLVDDGGLLKVNPGAGRFTLERVRLGLRQELDRRIMAATDLIKLNRERAVGEVLQRFSGWATSIPVGGSDVVDKVEIKQRVGRRLQSLSYIDRRLHIDQSAKLAASLSSIFAKDGGAIAGEWNQHYTRYPRAEHRKRNGKVFLVRDSWAHDRGLVKSGKAGYTDEITQPGEEISCRCTFRWLFGLSQLPSDMLTRKGRDELDRVRSMMAPQQQAA